MPDLNFHIEGVESIPHDAVPQLAFRLRIRDAGPPANIQSVLLRVQIRIEPTRRRYEASDEPHLRDLFGGAETWGRSMRSMLWTNANLFVPAFSGETLVDLPVPCTFDFNVGATKYFHALNDGEIPLTLLFSGTVFVETERGLQAMPISWEKEAGFRLPAQVWHEMMRRYYPNCVWLCLHRDAFARLNDYRSRNGLPTWEQALDRLLWEESRRFPLEDASALG